MLVFMFMQEMAYERRISDWSSDVCSSDLLVASLFERRAAGLYHNTAVVFDADGRIAGRYRKMHIPDDPGFLEKFYFTPGDLGFNPIDTQVGRLGVLVRSEEHTSELQSLMRISYAVFCLKKKNNQKIDNTKVENTLTPTNTKSDHS